MNAPSAVKLVPKGKTKNSFLRTYEATKKDKPIMEKQVSNLSLKNASFRHSASMSLIASISYGLASLSMVFINKAILMSYPYSMTLLSLQMAMTCCLLYLGKALGWIKMKSFNLATATRLLPLAFFYNANVAFALASLRGVNIPMYIALKRLTPMAVLIAGFFYGKAKPPLQVTLSVSLTVIGCVIAALGDFSFDLYGYAMALSSVLLQTGYLVMVERSGGEEGLSSNELMLYNSLLSLPFLLLIIIFTGEVYSSASLLYEKCWKSYSFTFLVFLSLIMGIVLNFTMFLCTLVNSALTTTIVGVLKGVVSTTLGFFILGGVKVEPLNVFGLTINTIGGVWYSYAKFKQKRKDSADSIPLIQNPKI